jgi:hypothetical protein
MTVRLLSLYGIDLARAHEDWRGRPLGALAARAPGGRLATLLASTAHHDHLPGTEGLPGLAPAARRAIFDALVDDLAEAAAHDIPAPTAVDVFAGIARLSGRAELSAPRLDGGATPAYPIDLLDDPAIHAADSGTGLATWIADPTLATLAASALRKALTLPAGSLPASDPTLWRDVAEAILPILEAATTPGHALLALRG